MKKTLLGGMLLLGFGMAFAQTSPLRQSVAKTPVQPPYYCTFDTEESMQDEWIVIDGDADGRSWYHERIGFFPTTCDGNDASGFAAVLWNQKGGENNDWLITASPVSLPAGKSNISFFYGLAQPFYEEYINVYCGKTTDTALSGLKKLGSVVVTNTGWYFAHFDFELSEAGDYYFSFQYRTPESNEYGVMLDNVLIDKGVFVGTPDLSVSRVILPSSSCSMGTGRIGVHLRNDGTADITEWAMSYSVNGGAPVRETFKRTLAEGKSDNFYFAQTFDFSEPGTTYEVEVNAEVLAAYGGKNEEKLGNNTGKNSVVHMQPVENFPYQADLRTEEGLREVGYNPDFWRQTGKGGLNAVAEEPLVTRCMTLEKEQRYRFIFNYKAGFNDGILISPDCFYVLFGEPGTPVSEWNTLKRCIENTAGAYETEELLVEGLPTGTYSIAILPGRNGGLHYNGTLYITDIRMERVVDNDVRLDWVKTSLAAVMPAQHARRPVYTASVVNRGESAAEDVFVSVKNGTEESAVSEKRSLKPGDTAEYSFEGRLAPIADASKVQLTVTAGMKAEDENPDNNTIEWTFWALDSLYAFDDRTVTSYTNGVGMQDLLIGQVFTLLETDTLTGVDLGWADLSNYPAYESYDFYLEIYSVDASEEIIACIYSDRFERPVAGGRQTLNIPARVLSAGSYMIGFRQTGKNNLALGFDEETLGHSYVKSNNKVQVLNGYGYVSLRAVFGRNASVKKRDIELLEFKSPLSRGVFAANEKVTVEYRNNGFEAVTLEFKCTADGKTVSKKVEVPAYLISGQVEFELDLSRQGTHTIEVEAVLEDDEVPGNNLLQKTVECIALNPYVMDFELCGDFEYEDLYPWKTVDVDMAVTGGIKGYDWPGCLEPMGFMAFNPYKTEPSIEAMIEPYGGTRCGAAFVCGIGANNDWLISPKLLLPQKNASLSFYTKAFSELLEKYNVLLSTTTDDLNSFKQLGSTYTADQDWTETVVNLDEYAGKEVYIAIQCVSQDAFVLFIDDIRVSSPVANESVSELASRVKSYPNPVTDVCIITAYGLEINRVEVYQATGSLVYRSAQDLGTETYRIRMDNFKQGLYMVRVYTNAGMQVLKVVVL